MENPEAQSKKKDVIIVRKPEKPHYPIIPFNSDEFNRFLKLLEVINLNWDSLDQLGACLKWWQLHDKAMLQIHINEGHKVAMPSQFATKELFFDLWKENGKINIDKTIVCLFDVMQIKHLLPKLEQMIRKSTTQAKQKEAKSNDADAKTQTAQGLNKAQNQQTDAQAKSDDIASKGKEKITIEYKNPDKKDLETEFFKSKIWDMMDHMAKKQEQTNERVQLLEHKMDMLLHKLNLASPDLNVIPLIGNNAFNNIFPKVYSTKQVEFFSFLAELYEKHLSSKSSKKIVVDQPKSEKMPVKPINIQNVQNVDQNDELEIIQNPGLTSIPTSQQSAVDKSKSVNWSSPLKNMNPTQIKNLLDQISKEAAKQKDAKESSELIEDQDTFPSINEAWEILNEVNKAQAC